MSGLTVRRLGYALGAEVRGVDLRRILEGSTAAAIRSAWLEHLVLCFPEQDIGKDELLAFAATFGGEFDDFSGEQTCDPQDPRIIFVTSKPEPGKRWDGYKIGRHWHSDKSYMERPATGTFLYAKELPDAGGDTIFANQYLAYETLSPTLQRILEGLSAVHSQTNLKRTDQQAEDALIDRYRRSFPPVVHEVVKTHPETGRKALYLGDRVRRFAGMTEEESAPFLRFLREHSVRYEFTYRHRWHVNDLVVWDNRCLMHFAPLDYDPNAQARHLIRCGLLGPATGKPFGPPAPREPAASA